MENNNNNGYIFNLNLEIKKMYKAVLKKKKKETFEDSNNAFLSSYCVRYEDK